MGQFISEEILGQESIRAGADVTDAVKDLNWENLVLHKGRGTGKVSGGQNSIECIKTA